MENIQEAIKILKSLGGDKNMLKVLETLESAQEHNEQLLVDATTQRKEAARLRDETDATLKEIQTGQIQVDASLAKLSDQTESTTTALATREMSINTKTAAFAKNTKEQNESLKQRENDLIARTGGVERRETVCNEKEAKFNRLEAGYHNVANLIAKVSSIA